MMPRIFTVIQENFSFKCKIIAMGIRAYGMHMYSETKLLSLCSLMIYIKLSGKDLLNISSHARLEKQQRSVVQLSERLASLGIIST